MFSSAAAHLARGVRPEELGPQVDGGSLVRLELPKPEIGDFRIRATVLYVDRYGNIQLNLARENIERAGIVPGRRVELELGFERYYATAARTFADARAGDIVLYEDAYDNVAVAITDGNAAEMFSVRPGQTLTLRLVR